MRYEPVLCDFDGTLADSAPVIGAALRSACSEVNVSIPPNADLGLCVGPPLERSIPQILGSGASVAEIIAAYRDHYMAVASTATKLMPGAQNALETWTSHGIRAGIVSYKPRPLLEAILSGLALSSYLTVVRAPEVGNAPPSKTALLQDALSILEPFGSRPVFIGDHGDDQQAADEASVDFIRYPESSWPEIQEEVLGS